MQLRNEPEKPHRASSFDRRPAPDRHGVVSNSASAADSPGRRRLPYEKPHIRIIELVAEEVLSVGCKLSFGPGGPIGATCTSASCFADGS